MLVPFGRLVSSPQVVWMPPSGRFNCNVRYLLAQGFTGWVVSFTTPFTFTLTLYSASGEP